MLLQDIKYALRSLWHSRGFATVAILCLGFGIGVNTTIFSIVDGVLLKPFPYKDPDRIVGLALRNRPRDIDGASVSSLDLKDRQAGSEMFEAVGAMRGRNLTIVDGGGEPERYVGAGITWN